MPVIDIIILIAITISVIIGLLRGFVKEAIAIAALLFARDLYRHIETLMKILVGLMVVGREAMTTLAALVW